MLIKAFTSLNLLKNASRPMLSQARSYPGMKHELYDYIKWVRPAKIGATHPSKSGDLRPLDVPKKDEYILNHGESEALKNANELTKRIFSLDLNPRKFAMEKAEQELIAKVQRHPLDYGSMEAKLASMTAKIRGGQLALEDYPRNRRMNTLVKELIERRLKFLKFLRRYDYRRFEYILEQLDIKYVPPPNKFHPIARKQSMRTLTSKYCLNIKNKRLEEYKEKLEDQQLAFLKNKIMNLEFIRKEQEECKIPVTISRKLIEKVKIQYDNLKVKREEEAEIKHKREVREDYEIKL